LINRLHGFVYKYTSIVILFAAALVLPSCVRPASDVLQGYKTVLVESPLASYSLEYPAYYRQDGPRTDKNDVIPGTSLTLEAPKRKKQALVPDPPGDGIKTVTGTRSWGVIHLNVFDPSSYFDYPIKSNDYLETALKGEARWKNFKLLERSPVRVSNVTGEIIVYQVDKLLPIPVENGLQLEYNRAIYFDYNNLIWILEAKADQDMADNITADFNHVIQTFKILN
jgi:hypothetical protein